MMPEEKYPPALFTRTQLLLFPILFGGGFFAANRLVHLACQNVAFDCPRYWPLSVFNPRWPVPENLLVAAFVLALGFAGLWRLDRTGYRRGEVALLGLALLLGTNLIQGTRGGFVTPIAGGGGDRHGVQYYHDAQSIGGDAGFFLRNFNARQATLREHGRTHPPGAVLLFHVLRKATGDRPAVIALVIAAVSVLLSAYWFRAWLATAQSGLEPPAAGYLTCLYLLLPAVQIYYAATLDALIAALLLGTVTLYARSLATLRATSMAALLLFLASFLTFGVVWVLPVLFVLDARRGAERRWPLRRLALILLAIAAGYLLLFALFGFSYLEALRTASRLENPQGFRLLHEPASYLFTRLENVAEIIVFFGPFLLFLFFRGLPLLRREHPDAFYLLLSALLSLTALFLTGAYRTGETARACLFLYPYLLLPVAAAALQKANPSAPRLLLGLTLAQTVLMQLFGAYFW